MLSCLRAVVVASVMLVGAGGLMAQSPPPPCGTPGVPSTYIDTLNGITAFSNDSTGPVGCYDAAKYEWECVEFVHRYYLQRFDMNLGSIPVAYEAFAILGKDPRFLTYRQGSTTIPRAEDIIVFGKDAVTPYGHVAIAKTDPILEPDGTYQIPIIEQNSYLTHVLVLQGDSVNGFKITGRLGLQNTAPIIGWVRRVSAAATSGSTAIITGIVNGKTVDKAYVPIAAQQKISVVNVDSTSTNNALIKFIPMPAGFRPNATAANPAASQVVAISYTSPDVQIIDASQDKIVASLKSPVTRTAFFTGGSCMVCGVLVDQASDEAILDTSEGYLLLDLAKRQFSPFIQGTTAGENFGYNPNTRTILNPTYAQGVPAGLQAINLSDNSVSTYSTTVGSFPDATAIDTSTNIAVVPDEFTGNQYLVNMGAASFDTSTSPLSFSAPSTMFPLTFTTCGSELHDWSLVSVEAVSHLLFLGTEFADCVAVESLPTTTITGAPPTPTTFHWGHMPPSPDGLSWNNGGDPHGIAVFTSVVDGRSYGFLVDASQLWVARVDLAGLKSASLKAGGGLNEVDVSPFVFMLSTQ